MAQSVKVARSAPQAKSAPQRKKVTTRTAQQRRTQTSPAIRKAPQVVVSKRSRRLVLAGLTISFVAIAMMMLVVVFQTRIAETQLNIDKIESQNVTAMTRCGLSDRVFVIQLVWSLKQPQWEWSREMELTLLQLIR